MIIQYTITGLGWTSITTAGQSGTCWLDEQDDGSEGSVDVRLWHGSVPGDAQITNGKRVYKPVGNHDVLPISADNGDDIYYATCANLSDKAIISVDVI